MDNYCNRCGLPLKEGKPCSCTLGVGSDETTFIGKISDLISGGASSAVVYERAKKIVPDCVAADEGEIPLRQYDVAVLRSRLKFQRAEGRLQVTNKRILFRAKGRSIPGQTLLQYEFDLGELSGIEARRDYKFSFMNFIIAVLLVGVGVLAFSLISMLLNKSEVLTKIFGWLFFVAGLSPFFFVKKKMELKLMSLGASIAGAYGAGVIDSSVMFGGGGSSNPVGLILGLVWAILLIIQVFLFLFVPRLVLTFKAKSGTGAVDIRAKKGGLLSGLFGKNEEFTGFDEVLPAGDIDIAMNEVQAMINDLKTLGDISIEKWKEN